MMYWGNGMSGWGVLFMTIGNLLFWGLLVAGIVLLVRYLGRTGQAPSDTAHGPTPQRLLAERYARGEIDDEEYTRRLHVLNTPPPPRPGG